MAYRWVRRFLTQPIRNASQTVNLWLPAVEAYSISHLLSRVKIFLRKKELEVKRKCACCGEIESYSATIVVTINQSREHVAAL